MAYLGWGFNPRSPVTGVVPFTYRDNITYLAKLEDLWQRQMEVDAALNAVIENNGADYAELNAAYLALIEDWNETLALLDPTAVAAMVQAFEARYQNFDTVINNKVTAIDTAYKAADTAIRSEFAAADNVVRGDFTSADNAAKTLLRGEFAAADTADRTTLNATITANKNAADSAINTLTNTKANAVDVPGMATSAVATAIGSATSMRAAFDSRYAVGTGSSSFPAQGNQGQRFYLSAYCTTTAQKTGNAPADAAVTAAMAAIDTYVATLAAATRAPGNPTLVVDGTFLLTTPIKPKNGLWIVGNGPQASRLISSTGHLIEVGANQWWYDFRIEGVGFEILPGGGSALYAAGVPYSGTPFVNEAILTRGVITSCTFRSQSTTNPIIYIGANAEMHSCTWSNLEIDRVTASTAVAMQFRPSQGNMMNSNVIRDIWIHGHNNVGPYAIELFITPGGGVVHNWTFRNICGEQNMGGLLNVNSCNGVIIEQCSDWDATGPYRKSIINIGDGNGTPCNNVLIRNCYPLGTISYASGAYFIQTTNLGTNIEVRGCHRQGSVTPMLLGRGASCDESVLSFSLVTSNYTSNLRESALFLATPNVTVTIPDPDQCPPGQTLIVVNGASGASSLITPNGRMIAGSSGSYTIGGQSAIRLVTDGQLAQSTPSNCKWHAL